MDDSIQRLREQTLRLKDINTTISRHLKNELQRPYLGARSDEMEASSSFASKEHNLTVINGWRVYSDSIQYKDGKLLSFRLCGPTTINGLLFDSDYNIVFYPTGFIRRGKLARNERIQGWMIPEKSIVEFYLSGRLRGVLTHTDEYTVTIGQAQYGRSLTFYSTGRLWSGVSAMDQTIQGVEVKKHQRVDFSFDGILRNVDS